MDTQIQATSAAATQVEILSRPGVASSSTRPTGKLEPAVAIPERKLPDRETEHLQIAEALARIQKFVEPMASELQFSIDEESGIRVVKVFDKATNEVIRQIPSTEMLEIAKALDRLQGILLRQKA